MPLADNVRNALSGMTGGPLRLTDAITFYARNEQRRSAKVLERELQQHVSDGPNGDVRKLLNTYLSRWDWEASASWTGGTEPNTRKRRDRIYDLLAIGKELRLSLDTHVPPYEGAKAVVIVDPNSHSEWYTFEFRRQHAYYWDKLREYLTDTRRIDSDAVDLIGASADRIVERLGNPGDAVVVAARGLVVGYVQSGKTTNFTAVIAKAIDAGYRLIIVLSGTTNLLRNQTQRRLDMELVGVENILKGSSDDEISHDYVEDDGWPTQFISYGAQPSLLGQIDIQRLTGQEDFTNPKAGLNPLEFDFEKRDKRRPLYERVNLDHAGARIAVVKKQQDRLIGLKSALKAVAKTKRAEIPALIIDDESDQASVNTVDPRAIRRRKVTKAGTPERERSAINDHIVALLELLPRAQYVGYTATPFANVFVNPNDPKDIYPKDFILSLPRPIGYMGAREFIDFVKPEKEGLTNQKAYVRDIPAQKGKSRDESRLLEAMDAFVLSGALKKFREAKTKHRFKHHTMLYHHSVKKNDHEEAVKRINALWNNAGYSSPGEAADRLEELLERDFRTVWNDRGRQAGLLFPKQFSALRPFLGAALDEIGGRSKPVLMVNSAEGADVPDFDGRAGVWKIIVGGAKLSRGYTIEGLTVSYFRRRAQMQDTLMQMGRWFGYRVGYSDLVRLYIGRAEPFGMRSIDLYGAWEAMCRDEEDFRAQLSMYEGMGGITPKDVPALVFNTHPRLRPTSRNKMFNAKVKWAAFDYREPTSQAASASGRKANAILFEKLIAGLRFEEFQARSADSRSASFTVKSAVAPHNAMISVLESVRWEKTGNPLEAQIEYLKRKPAVVSSWLIVAPQIVKGDAGTWKAAANFFTCVGRTRLQDASRFGVFSSPNHLEFAKWLVGGTDKEFDSDLRPRSDRGILLFYPTREIGESRTHTPVMGFGIVLPTPGSGQRIAFTV